MEERAASTGFRQLDKAEIEKTEISDGAGVIAGICYLQISGGKLASADGFKPYPLLPVPVSSEGKELVTVQTDQNGYFMAVLPAGTYSVGSAPITVKITVERGITTLVPLRIGKRRLIDETPASSVFISYSISPAFHALIRRAFG
jgi:hypothetical protein